MLICNVCIRTVVMGAKNVLNACLQSLEVDVDYKVAETNQSEPFILNPHQKGVFEHPKYINTALGVTEHHLGSPI